MTLDFLEEDFYTFSVNFDIFQTFFDSVFIGDVWDLVVCWRVFCENRAKLVYQDFCLVFALTMKFALTFKGSYSNIVIFL